MIMGLNFFNEYQVLLNTPSFKCLLGVFLTQQRLSELTLVDTQATDLREGHSANENCKRGILDQFDRYFHQHNCLAQTYQLIRDVEAQEPAHAAEAGDEAPKSKMIFRSYQRSDQHTYLIQRTYLKRNCYGVCQRRR